MGPAFSFLVAGARFQYLPIYTLIRFPLLPNFQYCVKRSFRSLIWTWGKRTAKNNMGNGLLVTGKVVELSSIPPGTDRDLTALEAAMRA